MAWFKERKEVDSYWRQNGCSKVFGINHLLENYWCWWELERNLFVSPEDGFHVRIGSDTYFEILFDNNEFVELDKNLTSRSFALCWHKKYADRLKDVMEKLT
jgi:acetyl-CoA carboxylase beta subunit